MLFFVLPLALVLSTSFSYPTDSSVILLSDSDFSPALLSFPTLLIQFNAPWCGHCRKLEPEYQQVAQKLAAHDPAIPVAKIDAVENPKTVAEFNVTGFPTMFFLSKGQRQEYRGAYTADAIWKWVLHKVDPPVAVLNSVNALEAFLTENKVAAVLFENQTSEGYTEFERAAQQSEAHIFAVSTSADSLEKYEVQTSNLVVFKPYDERKAVYNQTLSASAISSFVIQSTAPWVSLWNDTVISYVFTYKNPIVLVFYPYFKNTYYRAVMDDIALVVKDDIKFAYTDLETTDGYKLADFLGIEVTAQPTAMILDWHGDEMVKYSFTAESLNKETLREFIEIWKTEQLAPFLKSEKPSNKPSAIRRLTGKNFASVLAASTNSTLVLFHTPWSSLSRQALALLESIAKATISVELAQLDVGVNELPGERFETVPVMRLYAAGGTLLRHFEGEWMETAVRRFAEEQKTEL